ncbi:hypothetical protein [Streptomyces sp. NPDC014734]|uniref:hypothetical protein n=1 Tax=Streptomyces sp. NPDC014734 TaxID=3364886 RepID=UPI0037033872
MPLTSDPPIDRSTRPHDDGPAFLSFDTMSPIGATGAAVLGPAPRRAAHAAETVRGGVPAADHGQSAGAAALPVLRHHVERHYAKGTSR